MLADNFMPADNFYENTIKMVHQSIIIMTFEALLWKIDVMEA